MSLRTLVRGWVAIGAVLLAGVLGLSLLAVSTLRQAADAESRRSRSLRLAADELRQTSDDLTRMKGFSRPRSVYRVLAFSG